MKKCCWLYAKDRIATYAACFIGKTINELVEDFNKEVARKEVTPDQAYYREALLSAIIEKGVEVSAVSDGENVSFERPVRWDAERRSLELIE